MVRINTRRNEEHGYLLRDPGLRSEIERIRPIESPTYDKDTEIEYYKRKPRVAGQWEPREKPKRKAERFVSPSELAEISASIIGLEQRHVENSMNISVFAHQAQFVGVFAPCVKNWERIDVTLIKLLTYILAAK